MAVFALFNQSPAAAIQGLTIGRSALSPVVLADGMERDAIVYELELDWNDENCVTEVIMMEGRPLFWNLFLVGCSVHIDMVDGGEVIIEFP